MWWEHAAWTSGALCWQYLDPRAMSKLTVCRLLKRDALAGGGSLARSPLRLSAICCPADQDAFGGWPAVNQPATVSRELDLATAVAEHRMGRATARRRQLGGPGTGKRNEFLFLHLAVAWPTRLSVTVRLKTGAPGVESGSTQK
jgi:hypothetical protein